MCLSRWLRGHPIDGISSNADDLLGTRPARIHHDVKRARPSAFKCPLRRDSTLLVDVAQTEVSPRDAHLVIKDLLPPRLQARHLRALSAVGRAALKHEHKRQVAAEANFHGTQDTPRRFQAQPDALGKDGRL